MRATGFTVSTNKGIGRTFEQRSGSGGLPYDGKTQTVNFKSLPRQTFQGFMKKDVVRYSLQRN